MKFVIAAFLINLTTWLDEMAAHLCAGQHFDVFPGDEDDITRALLRAANPEPPAGPGLPTRDLPGPDVLEQVADLLAELAV